MELLELISVGLEAVWGIEPIGWMLLGTFLGIIVGATPGLSSGMAVALLLPITFAMSPLNALIFLTSTYVAVTGRHDRRRHGSIERERQSDRSNRRRARCRCRRG